MTRARPIVLGGLLASTLIACGSGVESTAGGSGGQTGPSSAGGAPSGDGGATAASSAGGGTCEPWEPCTCEPCDAQGGTCLIRCNFGAGYDCYTPGPPADDEFSCGGFVNCPKTEACIDLEWAGDSCIDHFCAALPDPCAFDRSCACLAQYIDRPVSEWGEPRCSVEGGEIHVTYAGFAPNPPWDDPWCGPETCSGDEICWACGEGEGATYVCAASDPVGDGSCTTQWGDAREP